MIKKLLSNEYLRGGFLLTFITFLGNILNYFFNLFIARTLGPSGLGEITTLFSYISIISVPLVIMTTLITQKISASAKLAYQTVQSLEYFFWSKIRKWWIYGLPLLLLTPFIPSLTKLHPLTAYSIPFLMIASLMGSFYTASFQGLKLFSLIALFGIISVLFKFAGALLVFLGVDGLATILIFLIISSILGVIMPFLVLRRFFKKKLPHCHILKPFTKRLKHIILNPFFLMTTVSMIALTAFNNIDIVIVKRNFSGFDAGIYSSWSLFAKIIMFSLGPITSVSFVFFSNNQKKLHRTMLNLSLVLLSCAGIVFYVIYKYFGAFIINILFGDKFALVIPYLGSASIFGVFYAIIFFINMYFIARKNVGALILAFFLPLYIILIFIQKSLSTIINIDIIFSFIVAVVYILFYVYNNLQWNKNKTRTS